MKGSGFNTEATKDTEKGPKPELFPTIGDPEWLESLRGARRETNAVREQIAERIQCLRRES